MARFLMNALATVVVLGLFLALLITFNWDLFAIAEWSWGITLWVVGAIADWFMSMPIFQQAVSR